MNTRLSEAIASSHPAIGMFLTCGFPTPDDTLDLLHAVERGGADFIELGMPFSDPLAEGLPIQRSSARALAAGMTMQDTLRIAGDFRSASSLPLLLMGYANPVLRYGVSNFFNACRSSGVDGVILPDVPLEESDRFQEAASRHDVNLVYLVSPLTPDDRLRRIDARSEGFVYAVSIAGVTGSELGDAGAIVAYLQHARSVMTRNPLMVGFGIRTRTDVERYAEGADGCIVGSELIRTIEHLWDHSRELTPPERLQAVTAFVHDLKFGTDHV